MTIEAAEIERLAREFACDPEELRAAAEELGEVFVSSNEQIVEAFTELARDLGKGEKSDMAMVELGAVAFDALTEGDAEFAKRHEDDFPRMRELGERFHRGTMAFIERAALSGSGVYVVACIECETELVRWHTENPADPSVTVQRAIDEATKRTAAAFANHIATTTCPFYVLARVDRSRRKLEQAAANPKRRRG